MTFALGIRFLVEQGEVTFPAVRLRRLSTAMRASRQERAGGGW